MEEKTALQRLEDLIDARFDGLEKQLSERNKYNEDKILELKQKDVEQDNRLNDHALRLRDLEKQNAIDCAIDKIKDALIKWAVPVVLAAVVYYFMHGGN